MHYLEEPDSQEDDLVGKVLCGKWRVLERVGRGGMSTVYAAAHRNGRKVAIKVLRRGLASNRRIVTRFLREGYVANKIRHPGAVAILDDDIDEDGTVFLVMELLDGSTLAERFRGRDPPPTLGDALSIAERLLDVLAAAHECGIVHRDVKPSNVFLTREGTVMLLDFGIARLVESEAEVGATHSGATLGTPGFMAPEQARGRGNLVDARTDVWAVGALLFFLLAGRTVHQAETPNELLIASATEPARSLREFCSALPEAVVAVVDRALDMDRERRWADAKAMKSALVAARSDVADALLGRPVERAAGTAAVATLLESNTAEPSVVSRRDVQRARSGGSESARTRRRALGWWIAAGAMGSLAAGVLAVSPRSVREPRDQPVAAATALREVALSATPPAQRAETPTALAPTAPYRAELTEEPSSSPASNPTLEKPRRPRAVANLHAVLVASPPVASPPVASPKTTPTAPTSSGRAAIDVLDLRR